MSHYQIVTNEKILDDFIETLPNTSENEVFYLCLFGRHKYCPTWKNMKDHNQLARFLARKSQIKEKIRRLECPLGSFTRDGVPAPQECLVLYIGLNPRSLARANRNLLVELAKRVADGQTGFNPVTLAHTEVHKAVGQKTFLTFDYDSISEAELPQYTSTIKTILPDGSYRLLITRGGFHLIVELAKVKGLKTNWYKDLAEHPNCDVKGTECLTPVPGCYQGGFTPHFVPNHVVDCYTPNKTCPICDCIPCSEMCILMK